MEQRLCEQAGTLYPLVGCPTCEAQHWWVLDTKVFLLCSGSRTKHIKYVVDAAVAGRKVANFGWYLDGAAGLWDGPSKAIRRNYNDLVFSAPAPEGEDVRSCFIH